MPSSAPPRRLQLLCAACGRLEVWSENGEIGCRRCGRKYSDFLELVPVKPVGPFAYLFGEGLQGYLTAGGIVAFLLGLWWFFRWLL